MPKFKIKKYPKKPKVSASAETLQNYLRKCTEIDKHNAPILAEKRKHEALQKKVREKKQKK